MRLTIAEEGRGEALSDCCTETPARIRGTILLIVSCEDQSLRANKRVERAHPRRPSRYLRPLCQPRLQVGSSFLERVPLRRSKLWMSPLLFSILITLDSRISSLESQYGLVLTHPISQLLQLLPHGSSHSHSKSFVPMGRRHLI